MKRTDPQVLAWAKRVVRWNRHIAKRKGLPFNITPQDVVRLWRTRCPVFRTPLYPRDTRRKCKPSLDRLVPKLGYVNGNVAVISLKANSIKNDANPLEIHAVSRWLDRVWRKRK